MSEIIERGDVRSCPTTLVRRARPSDATELAGLFLEMQAHYQRPVPPSMAREAAELACKPVTSTFDPRVLLAFVEQAIVGSAVLNVTFPAYELTRSLYIRDLYVMRAWRRIGVGRELVRSAVRLTVEEGFSALDWTTESTNTNARRMYEACGARQLDRTYYRLTQDDLDNSLY